MVTCNRLAAAALAAFLSAGSIAFAADDQPLYPSATEAYRQGVKALKAGRAAAAVPALEYAAKRGVLGAQVKLARAYASGRDVPKDDAKAFAYFEQIADSQADISPSSPIAKYAAEAFVALGQYHLDGIPERPLAANPDYAAHLFRHAASYFGDAEAQYRLARLYISGNGVEKNTGLAVNWLAIAAKKQHAAAQATLGEILWRGEGVRERRARGLALIILAHENAKEDAKDARWIGVLYDEVIAASDKVVRKDAEALLPTLGGASASGLLPAAGAGPAEILASPPQQDASASDAGMGLAPSAPPPAPIGLSVGFGGAPTEGDFKP
jgi:exopolysaccharide production negative regulator